MRRRVRTGGEARGGGMGKRGTGREKREKVLLHCLLYTPEKQYLLLQDLVSPGKVHRILKSVFQCSHLQNLN